MPISPMDEGNACRTNVMSPRLRSVLRWALGTLIFGSALVLLDISLYHFWHLRRPRSAPATWHWAVAVGSGAGALLLTWAGARLLRRWQQPKAGLSAPPPPAARKES